MYTLICVYMHIYKYFYRGPPVITFAFSILIHTMKEIHIATPIPTLSFCVCVCVCVFSCVQLFVTLWMVGHQAPLFMRFSRQEYWSGLPFLSPVDLPDPGIELVSLQNPVCLGKFFTTVPPGKPMEETRVSTIQD